MRELVESPLVMRSGLTSRGRPPREAWYNCMMIISSYFWIAGWCFDAIFGFLDDDVVVVLFLDCNLRQHLSWCFQVGQPRIYEPTIISRSWKRTLSSISSFISSIAGLLSNMWLLNEQLISSKNTINNNNNFSNNK